MTREPYTSSLDVRNSSAQTHTAFLRRTAVSNSLRTGPLTFFFVLPNRLVLAPLPYTSNVWATPARGAQPIDFLVQDALGVDARLEAQLALSHVTPQHVSVLQDRVDVATELDCTGRRAEWCGVELSSHLAKLRVVPALRLGTVSVGLGAAPPRPRTH